jgi:WD40-like Beta Propeller Repeat
LPVNLGDGVNTAANELQATLFEDDATGVVTVYFTSNRPGGFGGDDIYASILQPDETFGPAVMVGELSSPSNDSSPFIRRDGLEMFLTSDRPTTRGGLDLWVSTRATTDDPWSEPINLGPLVNTAAMDAGCTLSFHGTELYFSSNRAGGFGSRDIYRTTR